MTTSERSLDLLFKVISRFFGVLNLQIRVPFVKDNFFKLYRTDHVQNDRLLVLCFLEHVVALGYDVLLSYIIIDSVHRGFEFFYLIFLQLCDQTLYD